MVEILLCLVVGVSDGDTLRVRCEEAGRFQERTVRLAEIDAPEKRQAFGTVSRQALSELCFGQRATVQVEGRDRYGRMVAHVGCRGVDASESQVSAGMAWAYTRYLKDPHIKALENQARQARAGLWSESTPVPPWEWRPKMREGAEGAQRWTLSMFSTFVSTF